MNRLNAVILNKSDGITFRALMDIYSRKYGYKIIGIIDLTQNEMIKCFCEEKGLRYWENGDKAETEIKNILSREKIKVMGFVFYMYIAQCRDWRLLIRDSARHQEERSVGMSARAKERIASGHFITLKKVRKKIKQLGEIHTLEELMKEIPDYREFPKFVHFGKQEILDIQKELQLNRKRAIFVWLAAYNITFGEYKPKILRKMLKDDEIYEFLCRQEFWKMTLKYLMLAKTFDKSLIDSDVREMIQKNILGMKLEELEKDLIYYIDRSRDLLYCQPENFGKKRFINAGKRGLTALICDNWVVLHIRLFILQLKLNVRGYC